MLRWLLVAAVLSALAAGCQRAAAPPNVLLVSIDSLRADRLGTYGAERDTSPALDALATEGAVFEVAVAPTSWTLPSHVSMLTGLSIRVHGVEKPLDRIDPRRTMLAERFRDAGYRTAAFVSAPLLHRAYGFDRGFEIYENFGAAEKIDAMPVRSRHHLESHRDETAPVVIDAALSWLAEMADVDAPFFLFVHLWDPHYDYEAPEPYRNLFDPDYAGNLDASHYELNPGIHPDLPQRDIHHLEALYDAEVLWTDTQLARLFDSLRQAGRLDETVVSITADHGEEFFEHGRKGHNKSLYDESVRVPWIVRHPGLVPGGQRIGGVVSIEDVAPTLLELTGSAGIAEATGRSRAGVLMGREPTPNEPVLMTHGTRVALRGPDWKLVFDPQNDEVWHFDLVRDPGEQHPETDGGVVTQRLGALRERLSRDDAVRKSLPWGAREAAEIGDETRARLRELGYLE